MNSAEESTRFTKQSVENKEVPKLHLTYASLIEHFNYKKKSNDFKTPAIVCGFY